jgi:UDP-N-acetylmuramyl pentapeptide synthase
MPTTPHEDSRLHDLVHYPVGYLMGILRDVRLAEQAAQRLRDAGYTDVVIFNGPVALESIRRREHAANPVTRAWGRLSIYLESESDARQATLDALRQGHAVVMVYASGGAQEEQVVDILLAHAAHALTYFGRWTITELGR